MISKFLSSLLINERDQHLASGSFRDSDFIYAGKHDRNTREKVADEAIDRDLNIKALSFDDLDDLESIGERVEDKKLFYRHKNFTQGLAFEEKVEAVNKLKFLEKEYSLEIVNDPLISLIHDSKSASNLLFQERLENIEGVRATTQFSLEEAYDEVRDRSVVGKPDQGSLGNNVEKLDSVEAIDNYLENSEDDEVVFEEYIPHDQKDYLEDRRAYIVDGEVVATVNRENDEGLATNLAKGGEYVEGSDLEFYEEKGLETAAEGLGFAAVDYVKDTEDDEAVIYETNATPGTKYDDEFGGLINSVVDMMEDSDDEGSSFDSFSSLSNSNSAYNQGLIVP